MAMRNLDLLATFLAVYRAGSISTAATQLGRSQPSVSERIATLESALGVTLFARSRRGVEPSAEADRLAARVAEPVDQLDSVWRAPFADPTGVVRIGGASDVIATRLLPAVATLSGRGLRLEFELGLAQPLLDRLVSGHLDVVVSAIRPRHPAIRYRGLIDEEFVLIGAPALARTIDPGRMRDDPASALGHLPLVAYDAHPSILRRYWRSQFGARPANPLAIIVPDLRAVLAAVIAGAGISAVPRYLADAAIHAGTVEVVHRSDDPPINTLFVALPTAPEPSAATAVVLGRLRSHAATWDVF